MRDGLTGTVPVVVGWGYTEYDPWAVKQQGDFETANVASKVQQRLGVPVLTSSECEKFSTNFEPEDSQICAGGEQDKDSCRVIITHIFNKIILTIITREILVGLYTWLRLVSLVSQLWTGQSLSI